MKTTLSEWIGVGAALGLLLGPMLENVGLGRMLGICIGSTGGIFQEVKK